MQRQAVKREVQLIHPMMKPNLVQASYSAVRKKRVAGYARVSTEHEEQQTSYEAQVDYYTQKIKSRRDWEFVEVYTDKGITGTNTKKREGFNRMIQDALDGKIDLILTKSVSRFARNTVDTLSTIRKLKERGVAVFFEEQGIDTLDGKGELLITIMSSIAQEESRSISDNVTWGKRKCAADGKFQLAYKNFLGYKKGKDGLPEIVEEEAQIVRFIYRSFLQGKTATGIAKMLTEMNVATPSRKTEWTYGTVMSILQNEKYKGAALLQKTFTVDFLQKKTKVNEGEVPQYYIENSHEAIIDPVEHDRVQLEINRRRDLDRRYSSAYTFSSRVLCSECGAFYGRKVWHSNDPYKAYVWRCNDKYAGKTRCTTPHFYEDVLKRRFVDAFNQRAEVKKETLVVCRMAVATICDLDALDAEIKTINDEIKVLVGLSQKLIDENAKKAQDQEEYQRRYSALQDRFEVKQARLIEMQKEKERRIAIKKSIDWFIDSFEKHEGLLEEFDEELFFAVTDVMIAYPDGRIAVRFRDGVEIMTTRF